MAGIFQRHSGSAHVLRSLCRKYRRWYEGVEALHYGKTVMKELAFIIHPRNVRKTRFEGKTVEHEVLRSINVFLVAYLGIFVLSVMLISLDNFDFATNFTAVAATLNNIGPGLAKVGPTQNFGIYSNFQSWFWPLICWQGVWKSSRCLFL